jgi:3,4-dihydroxy-2-butanone 4-phosphate synthase
MAPIAVSTSPQLQASVPLKKVASMAEPAFKFDSMEDALAAFARGEFIVVMDDEDRENEGDLIAAASTITTEKMAWFIKHTRYALGASMCPSVTYAHRQRLYLHLIAI